MLGVGDALRVLFWTWCGVSVSILAFRFVRRRTRPATAATDTTRLDDAPGAASVVPPSESGVAPTTAPLGQPQPRGPDTTTGVEDRVGSRSPDIAAALGGIDWPCGLTPVVEPDQWSTVMREVAFSTTGATAEEVHRALIEAMTSRGFQIEEITSTDALARRDGDEVTLSTHTHAGEMKLAGTPRYPRLPPDAVVVLLALR